MDLVYIVRKGNNNEQLRYSLRSIKNLPHDKVWISGHTPRWVKNVHSIPGNKYGYKWLNGPDNVYRAVRNEKVSDPFILMNDDFFIMKPTTIDYIEYVSTCWWGDLEYQYRTSRGTEWKHVLRLAYRELTARGIENPLAFTLHVPLIVEKDKMKKVFEEFDHKDYSARITPEFRTLYGNYWNMGTGEQLKDCKVRKRQIGYMGQPLISTHKTSFAEGQIGKDIRNRFSEPSPYEVTR